MIRPTIGEVLLGITDGLRHSVLPALEPGAAQRQLKAALHALGRLQKSWDLMPAYIAADNDDLRPTLRTTIAALEPVGLPRTLVERFNSVVDASVAGGDRQEPIACVNDAATTALAQENLHLQGVLASLDEWLDVLPPPDHPAVVEQRRCLRLLHGRMVDRELAAWAVKSNDERN
jgi:hypothetical protein